VRFRLGASPDREALVGLTWTSWSSRPRLLLRVVAHASAAHSVAGRWPSPHSSSALGRCRPGPRGRPVSAVCPVANHRASTAAPSGLPFRALAPGPEPLATFPSQPASRPGGAGRGLLLSWDSSALHPFAERPSAHPLPPDPDRSGRRNAPLRRDRSRVRADGATRRHPVPPSWFLTTSTVFSARRLRVCCASLPAMGFTAFPAPALPLPRGGSGSCRGVPRGAVHTLRRVPLVDSRAASLRPLPSCRCHSAGRMAPPGTPVARRHSQCRPD